MKFQLTVDCADPDRLARRTNAPDGMDQYAVAMLDPEGNEFDVF